MKISIASGKGGTGKTTVAVNLALSLPKSQYIDCDVEEPNGHIFLNPVIQSSYTASVLIPVIDETRCTLCGTCSKVCEYKSIAQMPHTILVFKELCHGCGACTYLCPNNAITEIKRGIGQVEIGYSGNVSFVHGKLNIGEAMSPPLIREVLRNQVDDGAIIIDSPPGTSCPMIDSIKQTDYVVLVTEPTLFGLNDLKIAVEVVDKLNLPFGLVINKADEDDRLIEDFCSQINIPVLMKIPFDQNIARAYSSGVAAVSYDSELKTMFLKLFEDILTHSKKSFL